MDGGGWVFSSGGYYAASLASACDAREEKGELGGEGADHVVPGPHAAGAHNAVLCQQLAPCFSGSPAHFTRLTVDENILTVSSKHSFKVVTWFHWLWRMLKWPV